MIGVSGAIRSMTAWQMPTHSLRYPKSERNTIDGVIGTSPAPRYAPGSPGCNRTRAGSLRQGDGADPFGLDPRRGLVEHAGRDVGLDGHAHQRLHALPLGLATNVHRGDVDAVVAEDRADLPDDPGPVDVVEEHHPRRRRDLDVEVVHVRDPVGVPGDDRALD